MKKLKLRMEDLRVQSLAMPIHGESRGTVHGRATSFTCGGQSCGGTCFETCYCPTAPDYCVQTAELSCSCNC